MVKFIIEVTGWAAATMMLSAYLLLTASKITASSRLYHWLNALSGAGFIINSGWNGAYPSACINVVWMMIGLYGLSRRRIAASGTDGSTRTDPVLTLSHDCDSLG